MRREEMGPMGSGCDAVHLWNQISWRFVKNNSILLLNAHDAHAMGSLVALSVAHRHAHNRQHRH